MINKRRLRMKERKNTTKEYARRKGTGREREIEKKCDEGKDDDNLLVQGFEQRPGPDKDTIHNN